MQGSRRLGQALLIFAASYSSQQATWAFQCSSTDEFNSGCTFSVEDASFNKQWEIQALRVCEVWNGSPSFTGDGITVAVMDIGIFEGHDDLLGQVEPVQGGCSEQRPATYLCAEKIHGTLMASAIAALRNNYSSLEENRVGIAFDVTLAELWIYDEEDENHYNAQEWADTLVFNEDCIDTLVCAWDFSRESGRYTTLQPVILNGIQVGVLNGRSELGQVYVFAGGNGHAAGDRTDTDELISSRYTIAVGAIELVSFSPDYQTLSFARWEGSELGASLLCCAPGSQLLLAARAPNDCEPPFTPIYGCENLAGTSYAAPCAAGVIALMMEANSNLAWRDVMEAIVQTSATINPGTGWQTNTAGFDHSYEYGHGLVDARAAVSYVHPLQYAPQWEPLLGEREIIVTLDPNGLTVGPGQTRTLYVEVERSMRVEHVELLMDVDAEGDAGIGPLEIEIDRLQLQSEGDSFGGGVTTRSVFTVARTDTTSAYRNPENDEPARFTSVRHWGENASATWKVRLRNTSTQNDPVTATWNVAELRFYGTPKNIADWDMDTNPSQEADCDLYMAWYGMEDPRADLNGDRAVDSEDLALFDAAFDGECP